MTFAPDNLNALWELAGGAFVALNCWRLHRDKMVKGVHWATVTFFTGWGYWNLYYYPAIGQWWSFAGGCSVVAFNTVWLAQLLYYSRKEGSARAGSRDESPSHSHPKDTGNA